MHRRISRMKMLLSWKVKTEFYGVMNFSVYNFYDQEISDGIKL